MKYLLILILLFLVGCKTRTDMKFFEITIDGNTHTHSNCKVTFDSTLDIFNISVYEKSQLRVIYYYLETKDVTMKWRLK